MDSFGYVADVTQRWFGHGLDHILIFREPSYAGNLVSVHNQQALSLWNL